MLIDKLLYSSRINWTIDHLNSESNRNVGRCEISKQDDLCATCLDVCVESDRCAYVSVKNLPVLDNYGTTHAMWEFTPMSLLHTYIL